MKLPRLKLWSLCLAVAASAVVIKLAMMAGPILTFSTSVIFLGPLSGIVVDRRRGGTGIAGGIVAGILSGLALSAHMNVYSLNVGIPFSWRQFTVSTTTFVIFEAFCGWFWGRTYQACRLSLANQMVANPKRSDT